MVVNKWASWCGPCRFEFPHFQAASAEHGDEVAFLGVDTEDSDRRRQRLPRRAARCPTRASATPTATTTSATWTRRALPSTAFYDAGGKLVHVKQGPYASEAELNADIERYARLSG